MQRRGFLQALGAMLGGLVIAPESIILPHTPVEAASVAPLSDMWMIRRVLALMDDRLGRQFKLINKPGLMIGDFDLRHQFSVGFNPFPSGRLTPHEFEQRYLSPVAGALASRVRDHGITTFGRLPLPDAAESASEGCDQQSGLAVRYIRAYNVVADQMLGRFDILAA